MAMYYYASKISAIACGTRCKQTVLQKSRGQRDRDKYLEAAQSLTSPAHLQASSAYIDGTACSIDELVAVGDDSGAGGAAATAETSLASLSYGLNDGVRLRRRYSEQHLDTYDIDTLGFQALEVSTVKSSKATSHATGNAANANSLNDQSVQYDVPKNTHKRSYCDVNYESSVLGSGGVMYINGRIVSGPLESLIEFLVPKNPIDFDKEFIFSFLLSSRLFLRPHELLGKLLVSVPDSESSESLVALLAEWANKFPYDFRDERMMNHVKHIVARCSNTHLEDVVSQILSALLKRLTDLERHEADLRACQTNNEKPETSNLDCATASQYAQILCRLEKKLAKQIGPEEFLQCSTNILLDKQKKWDQPATAVGPPGAQDPKKTCNLETYLDWSARLRLFVCNEILKCIGIHDRSRTVELWSGVAQYCLLVGNYNSATAILESLESPPIARLKITWSKLQVTCQQLDCMQRHAEGYGDLWHKQAIVLNENHQKTDSAVAMAILQTSMATTKPTAATTLPTTALTLANMVATTNLPKAKSMTTNETPTLASSALCSNANDIAAATAAAANVAAAEDGAGIVSALGEATSIFNNRSELQAAACNSESSAIELATFADITGIGVNSLVNINDESQLQEQQHQQIFKEQQQQQQSIIPSASFSSSISMRPSATAPAAPSTPAVTTKSNDWVVIPVFADIVKLALTVREDCLQRLPNGHINIGAFDRLAAIVGAFTKHMHAVKSASEAPLGEYEKFCRHMQKTSKLNENELMMASFDCEEPNNAEKLMYDLN